jgi:hypothetical protein
LLGKNTDRFFEIGVLRRTSGPNREEVAHTGEDRLMRSFVICTLSSNILLLLSFFLSFLGSTAQLRPWPPPQNPAEFLGGFSTIFFVHGRVVIPTPNPIPEDQTSVFISPRGRVATHFTRLLRH